MPWWGSGCCDRAARPGASCQGLGSLPGEWPRPWLALVRLVLASLPLGFPQHGLHGVRRAVNPNPAHPFWYGKGQSDGDGRYDEENDPGRGRGDKVEIQDTVFRGIDIDPGAEPRVRPACGVDLSETVTAGGDPSVTFKASMRTSSMLWTRVSMATPPYSRGFIA